MHELRHMMAGKLVTGCNCRSDPDLRVLRRVSRLEDLTFGSRGGSPVRRISIVDTETTGTDPTVDEIIDIAAVTVEVDAAGEIVAILSKGEALRDPGVPIPPAITRLTGISDEDVRGQHIDLDRLERVLGRADVLIAHNAAFDAAFLESLLPGIAGKPWACSADDIDWVALGFDGRKLGHLLMQVGHFNDTHRAMADVVSLVHLLAHRLPHGGTIMGDLLTRAERPTFRIEATAASYDKRGLLKAHGYRWDPRMRVWWIEVSEEECDDELAWLRREVSPYGPPPRVEPISWHQRHR